LIDRIPEIKNRVSNLLSEELRALSAIRQKESNLVLTSYPKSDQWIKLLQIHQQVLRFGEIPDYTGAQKFCLHLAASLTGEQKIQSFCELCAQACRLPEAQVETWNFLEYLGGIALQEDSAKLFPAIVKGILAAIQGDWPTTLWIILSAVGESQEPPWVHALACQVRKMQFGIPSDTPTPLMAVKRSLHALQTAAKLQEDIRARTTDDIDVNGESSSELSIPELIEQLRKIVESWTVFDPDPPDSGVEYSDIERLLIDIGIFHPASLETISRAIEQPKAQIRLVMEAWGRKEFDAARRGLRYAFLWDPDRRRLFQADLAVQAATAWLAALSWRPRRDLTLLESITPLELEGRELRNQVGSARWLDLILDALTRLRKGANPADLVYEKPELKSEIPWLSDLEPPRPTKGLSGKTVRLERQSLPIGGERTVRGIQEARLGAGTEFALDEPLDTWIAEARGSSARVFAGSLRTPVQGNKSCAIKVMRSDRVDYGLPLFREETQILSLLRDVQGITPLLECGFIQLDPGQELPSDTRHISAEELSGTVLRYAPEEVLGFLSELEKKSHAGWLPYLAVDKYLQSDNLIQYCDTGHNHGRFLPLDALLSMTIQICDILEIAHARNIVYRDHKILHYYWLEPHNGIFIIDWNVAKRHPHGLSAEEKQFDLVQFGARALHHIFTGRPAPGALPLGPTRPDEIEAAAHTYKPQWTYDDLRLPTVLKEILEKILAGGYTQVRSLRYDLFQVYQQLSITNI
jgi:serine/threonine protein kinase